MIFSILRIFSEGITVSGLCYVFARIFIIFTSFPVHECAHAWAAYKLGDDTARLKGRLTLAPFAHLDLIGTLMILLVGFGYAKPVPVNIRNFKNRKRDFALTALAGPLSNLIMALLFFVISNVFRLFIKESEDVCYILGLFFLYAGNINVALAVFNLLPIPPLDGSRLATAILPDRFYYRIMQYERYLMIGLFVLLMVPMFSTALSTLIGWISHGIEFIAWLPFMSKLNF